MTFGDTGFPGPPEHRGPWVEEEEPRVLHDVGTGPAEPWDGDTAAGDRDGSHRHLRHPALVWGRRERFPELKGEV